MDNFGDEILFFFAGCPDGFTPNVKHGSWKQILVI